MAYEIQIGEAKITIDTDNASVGICVKSEKHDSAPAFGEPTDYTNERWPAYTVWREFCGDVELSEMFYDTDFGLMRSHPGAAPITKEHQLQVNEAIEKFKKRNPRAVPKIADLDRNKNNYWLARLTWLKYWIDWALDNCKNPIIANS